MAQRRLRVALDANVLIAGIRLPRWPHEVMRACLGGFFDLVLPVQVIVEASRHLTTPTQTEALRFFLDSSHHQELPMPSPAEVRRSPDLVRSEKDVPIALAVLHGEVDIFVSNDRDFTDPTATAERFRTRVRVMLPAVFLRDVLGWSSEALEAIRTRTWADLLDERPAERSEG
jgi:predicted nucleic acid-binding protein